MVTVLTRTIGPSGRDYSSFTLAEADVANIGTSADLVANDEAIVFEADAGTYAESGTVYLMSSLTTDATRQVTYKPASGAAHGGSESAGVIVRPSTTGTPFDVRDNFAILDGLVLEGTNAGANGVQIASATAEGTIIRDCMVIAGAYAFLLYGGGSAAYPIRVENCVARCTTANFVVRTLGLNRALYAEIINCTLRDGLYSVSAGANNYDADVSFVNVLALNPSSGTYTTATSTGTLTVTGSNNFGGSSNPFPAAIQGSPYPITPSTAYDPGAGDFALYVGKNGALLDSPNNDVIGQGVGPSANSDVPTTDILGNARSGSTANPGAFEQPQATATITKTIGPSGRDYTTFTLAEADVTNIGGSADLVNENERIVFEADAGTYSESVNIQSTLTTDATRQVTYKPAAGSEHGGIRTAGVIIDPSSGNSLALNDDFTKVEGLVCAKFMQLNQDGCIADGCISIYRSTDGVGVNAPAGTSAAPVVLKNCVIESTTSHNGIQFYVGGAGAPIFAEVINCTFTNNGIRIYDPLNNGPVTLTATNNIVLGGQQRDFEDNGGHAVVTGSNNFGARTSSNQFPAAIQGSPYPITATTDAEGTPASGDFAIHDSNGRLYNITTNDVWQAGIGPASDSDVPTTDILGATRSGTTANPGAFELGVNESNDPPALPGLTNATPDFRVHLDRRVTDATTGVSSSYDASTNTTTFTLPYKLNTAATMQVVTRKTSSANAGQSLTVVSTDATNRRVVVSGNHTGTAVFIGEKYTMKYEFSELHLQRDKNTYTAQPIVNVSHRVRYGRLSYGDTSFFKVTVTPYGGTASSYIFNGNLLNDPVTQVGASALYDGVFQFPVMSDHDRVTVLVENDSPLPSRLLSCEWESFYHSRIGARSRF